jgi:hypothetical protein
VGGGGGGGGGGLHKSKIQKIDNQKLPKSHIPKNQNSSNSKTTKTKVPKYRNISVCKVNHPTEGLSPCLTDKSDPK